jgi:hypothetical protein
MITREALMVLENNLTFTKFVNREYDDKFGVSGAKIGTTLRVRKPARYTVRDGATASIQDHVEAYVNLPLTTQKGVDLSFTSAERTLSLDDFSSRILKPAVSQLANQIDYDGLGLYAKVANLVGTPGTTPATALAYLQAGQKLDEMGAPVDDQRSVVINPAAQAATVDGLKGLFQSSNEIAKQYRDGKMGIGLGFKFSMDQNVNRHTVGVNTGTPLVNGANQTGATLNTDGWTASQTNILKAGDVFTIAGVYAVNPQTRESTGALQQFVVLANVNSGSGAGAAALSISPSIVTSGALQTVTASPADDAVITVVGVGGASYPQNLAFHKDAFTLACADLELPDGLPSSAKSRISDKRLGLSLRMCAYYDGANDINAYRLDVLYGWACIRPELACRITG